MRFVLQRVKHASVKVDGELIGSIGRGYIEGACRKSEGERRKAALRHAEAPLGARGGERSRQR